MWRNWTGDQTCTPAHRANPRTVQEVSSAVIAAAERGQVVRVVGGGHAFGDNVTTTGTLISLDGLTGLHAVDRERGLVRVAAGTRLVELNALLDEHGLALPNLGDINVQSVAGAISTATHGTGARFGNLATLVESMEIVAADGSVIELRDNDLRAGRVSVGALGVVTAYTLRTVPSFHLHERRAREPLAQVLEELDERVQRHDHVEFFVFPHARDALTKTLNRTQEPVRAGSERRAYLEEVILENRVLDVVCRAGRRFPGSIPRLNRLVTALAGSSDKVNVGHRVFSSPRLVRFTETEWAFPREACSEVLQRMLTLIASRYDVNFPIEVRFTAADTQSMLSPSFDRDTAYLAFHMYQGMPWEDFFDSVRVVAAEYGARPHWGKRHTLDAAALSELYPEWAAFQEVRCRLDPQGVFANVHIERIFG
ncbi:MAG: FAD-binding protein [Phycicoccus sp.]|nr:FAD-binding protein [Phycicoccus sp.]